MQVPAHFPFRRHRLQSATMFTRCVLAIVLTAAASLLAGCHTTIVPLRPLETIEVEADGAPATAPAAMAATAPAATQTAATMAATSEPATLAATARAPAPAHAKITRVIDPNQTSKFVYDADYDRIWQQAQQLLAHLDFRIDRHDYRLGVLTTAAKQSAELLEPWRRDRTGLVHALENTINDQRYTIRISIATVPGKPKFYQISVQVLVERAVNPSEMLGGPIFVAGSGFGRNIVTLQSDYLTPTPEGLFWNLMGRDPVLEAKILRELFERI